MTTPRRASGEFALPPPPKAAAAKALAATRLGLGDADGLLPAVVMGDEERCSCLGPRRRLLCCLEAPETLAAAAAAAVVPPVCWLSPVVAPSLLLTPLVRC